MSELKATMAGSVCRVVVTEGEQVRSGQDVVILESMKMEIPVVAEQDGIVVLKVEEGDFVDEGDVLAVIE